MIIHAFKIYKKDGTYELYYYQGSFLTTIGDISDDIDYIESITVNTITGNEFHTF